MTDKCAPNPRSILALHAENVGKTANDLVALWNQAHPDDPVED
jgi:hypothetical protein